MKKYKVGDEIKVIVTGIVPYGIFVKADENYVGLIHISEVSNSFVRNLNMYATIGSKLRARIIDVDNKEKKLRLSIKDFECIFNKNDNSEVIIETESGFSQLKNQLDIWIEKKLIELDS